MTDWLAEAVRHAQSATDGFTPAEAARVTFVPHGGAYTTRSGVTIVQLQQEFLGIPIQGAQRSVQFSGDAPPRVTGASVRVPDEVECVPTVPVVQATYAACVAASKRLERRTSNRRPRLLARLSGPEQMSLFTKVGFEQPITAALRLQVTEEGLALVWVVRVEGSEGRDEVGGSGDLFGVVVAATPGRRPDVLDITRSGAHVVRGLVHTVSPPSSPPTSQTFPLDRSAYPSFGGASAPPGPWLSTDATDGNNVSATDRKGRVLVTAPAGADTAFQPSSTTGVEQGQLNAFYLCNYLHDFFYLLGFTEAMRNFQKDNFTGSGLGADSVRVTVSDRDRDDRPAFFLNRTDGRRPDLKLRGLHGRLTALDADVIIHEYVHGVTDRMVGRGETERPFTWPQSIALAEGTSDYFALSIQNYLRRRSGTAPSFVFGAWISGDAPGGLRQSPYGAGFSSTYGSLRNPGYTRHHDAGQVWAQALLNLNEALADAGDADSGDERGWQLVFDSLVRLHAGTSGPHFLHARDAILDEFDAQIGSWGVPDEAALRGRVWQVFTERGLGGNAVSGSAGYQHIVEDLGGNT